MDRRIIGLAAVLLGLAACRSPAPDSDPAALDLDRFGGLADLSFTSTGYFHLEHGAERDWLVDPDGHAFFSAGVNHVAATTDTDQTTGASPYHEAVMARYGDEGLWADEVVRRFASWRLNTIGAWSDHDRFAGRMPYTVLLDLAQGSWHPGSLSDVFSSSWEDGVRRIVADAVAPRADDPWLVGYFTDNELRWTRDWTSMQDELFDDYLALDAAAAGKLVLVQGLEQRYGDDVAAFDRVWDVTLDGFSDLLAMQSLAPGPQADTDAVMADKRAFLETVAERYFSFTSDAIRRADPNHLVLGCRLVPLLVPEEVLEAAGRHVDVVSVNNYVFVDGLEGLAAELFAPLVSPGDFLARFAEISGRPILVSEFGFRAADAGLPNTWPPVFPVYADQKERADALEAYLRTAFAAPYLVGLHWFEYVDEPAGGRFDGEDCNWGLVDVNDDPYRRIVERLQSVYTELWQEAIEARSTH